MTMGDRACWDLLHSWDQELLLLSDYGKDGHSHGVVPKVSQETLDDDRRSAAPANANSRPLTEPKALSSTYATKLKT